MSYLPVGSIPCSSELDEKREEKSHERGDKGESKRSSDDDTTADSPNTRRTATRIRSNDRSPLEEDLHHFPKLGADLITALAGLKMDNFSHLKQEIK
jgi:hypothetical protein